MGDILSEMRQKELDEVAGRLARWEPDGFFVECDPPEQSRIDSLYSAYRAGDYDPTPAGDRGEIRQLGFRVGKQADLEQLRCVDAGGVWLGAEADQVARQHDPAVLAGLDSLDARRLDESAYLADHTIRELLVEMNTERRLWQNHKAYNCYYARVGSFDGSVVKVGGTRPDYLVLADRDAASSESGPGTGVDTVSLRGLGDLVQKKSEGFVGFPDHHIGADLVGEWYKRNLRICANIWRAVDERDERVVVLIGQGHVWTLRTFLRENPEFEVVPVDEVL